MTATEIARLLANQAEAVCEHLLPHGRRDGRDWSVGSVSGEPGNSMKVTLSGTKAGVWCDFGGSPDDRGDLIGLWMATKGVTLSDACQQALDWLQVPHHLRNARNPAPARKLTPTEPDRRWLELQASMRPGTYSELEQLASLRRLPNTAGLQKATTAGHLWFGQVHDAGTTHLAWILTDSARRNAQARKLDGSLWVFDGKRKPSKSKTIWGTDTHWPVGAPDCGDRSIALVEGSPDFLAAYHLVWALQKHIQPVAMFGVSNAIHPDALQFFANKKVWIFPHNDDNGAGKKGCAGWKRQLEEVGATCFDFDFASLGVKDLNDAVTAEAEQEMEVVS
jgi:hypothetical protein